jgi:galactoside 2-L-fucosyltransferase 1/2
MFRKTSLLRRLSSHQKHLVYAIVLCTILLFLSSVFFIKPRTALSPSIRDPVYVTSVHKRVENEIWPTTKQLMTCQRHGRLGNMMFAYAALVGIARLNNRTPALPDSHFLRSLFHVHAALLTFSRGSVKITESLAGTYDARTEHIVTDAQLIELVGYFQSWRYFSGLILQIRSEFSFRHEFAFKAAHFLDQAIAENFGRDIRKQDVVLVGIHVRVRDMATNQSLSRGYAIASPGYLSATMNYFQLKYAHDKLLFVMATDDKEWCRNYFPYQSLGKFPLVHTVRDADALDMAILGSCNHTIITVGSFGWWAAWLAGGVTLYFKDFPQPNSDLARQYNKDDYYPSDWIGL